VRLAALILLVACEHQTAPAKPPGDPPCVKVAHHMLDLMTKDPDLEAAKKLNDFIRQRCEEDLWTVHAQTCMLAMKTIEDHTPCEEMLTVEQRDRLVKGIDEMFPRKD
jgi:hypothetical protein